MAQRDESGLRRSPDDKNRLDDEYEGSTYTESESSNSEESEDEEPVLKYKRFAKEVVTSTCEGPDGARNIISCIAVHPKVSQNVKGFGISMNLNIRTRLLYDLGAWLKTLEGSTNS